MKIRHWWVATALVVFVLSTPVFAFAFIYDWTSAGVQVVTDSPGDSLGGLRGTDIVTAYHASAGTDEYFRMDLAAAPTRLGLGDGVGTAETYAFYIDSLPGSGAPAGVSSPIDTLHPHVPPVSGIDTIVRMNTDVYGTPGNPLGWTSMESYQWDSITGNFIRTERTNLFAHDENGGKTLEWRYNDSNGLMGSSFTWWAANMGPTLGVVNDIAARHRDSDSRRGLATRFRDHRARRAQEKAGEAAIVRTVAGGTTSATGQEPCSAFSQRLMMLYLRGRDHMIVGSHGDRGLLDTTNRMW